jgi:molybdopterin converting factor subunit 1
MLVRVLLFAGLREIAGVREAGVEVGSGASVGDLGAELVRRWPGIRAGLDRAATAVKLEYVGRAHRLADGDEVAFVPPVSGGRGWSA